MHNLDLLNVDCVIIVGVLNTRCLGERVLTVVVVRPDADLAGILYVSCTPCSTLKMYEVGLGSD